MEQCAANDLPIAPDYLYIDGNKVPPHLPLRRRGDCKGGQQGQRNRVRVDHRKGLSRQNNGTFVERIPALRVGHQFRVRYKKTYRGNPKTRRNDSSPPFLRTRSESQGIRIKNKNYFSLDQQSRFSILMIRMRDTNTSKT